VFRRHRPAWLEEQPAAPPVEMGDEREP
jgi:hypothetical protein